MKKPPKPESAWFKLPHPIQRRLGVFDRDPARTDDPHSQPTPDPRIFPGSTNGQKVGRGPGHLDFLRISPEDEAGATGLGRRPRHLPLFPKKTAPAGLFQLKGATSCGAVAASDFPKTSDLLFFPEIPKKDSVLLRLADQRIFPAAQGTKTFAPLAVAPSIQ